MTKTDIIFDGRRIRIIDVKGHKTEDRTQDEIARSNINKYIDQVQRMRPKITLIGSDSNAFKILGEVKRALEKAGQPGLVKEYLAEATKGDYNHLLETTMKYVDII